MYVSKIKTPYRKLRKARLSQGDILRDVTLSIGREGTPYLDLFFPYAVIMSQDCDIESDYKERSKSPLVSNDKFLNTILICPAYVAAQFALGTHIDGWQMEGFNEKLMNRMRKNDEYKRYHYLASDTDLQVPDLVVDFKHFYTASRDDLYRQKNSIYLASINELFREDLSHRFANFLSRIGLPEVKS
jgi:hypothetical protein